MDGIRYANIGIAVGMVIVVAGVLVFRHSEGALQAVGLIGMFVGLAVALCLYERADRRNKRHTQ